MSRVIRGAATLVLLVALSTGCNTIQDAGTADRGSGFDRTGDPLASPHQEPGGEGAGPGGNGGLQALCAVPALPASTPAQLAIVSKAVQEGIAQLEPDTYTPQLAAIVRTASELLAAAESERVYAGLDPALAASFRASAERRGGSIAALRAELAQACGAKKPG